MEKEEQKLMPQTFLAPRLFSATYEWIMEMGEDPYITVDCAVAGVDVPVTHITNGRITLNLAPRTMADFHAGEYGLSFKARFNRVSMDLFVPYNAILAMFGKQSGKGVPFHAGGPVLPGDEHLVVIFGRGVPTMQDTHPKVEKKGTVEEPSTKPQPDPAAPTKPKGSHLKVVK